MRPEMQKPAIKIQDIFRPGANKSCESKTAAGLLVLRRTCNKSTSWSVPSAFLIIMDIYAAGKFEFHIHIEDSK